MVAVLRISAKSLRRLILPTLAIGAASTAGYFMATRASTPVLAKEVIAPEIAADAEFHKTIQPLLVTYCYDCHGDGTHLGNLALDNYKSAGSVAADGKKWDMVYRYVRTHQMPPSTENQPSASERKAISDWVDSQLYGHYTRKPDPGAITIHRLNRVEYDNTIKDLIGIDAHPSSDFPADDSGYGFDNIADVLSLPPMLMEKYIAAADTLLDQAIVTDPIKTKVAQIPAPLAEIAFYAYGARGDGWVQLDSGMEDFAAIDLNAAVPGEYALRFSGYARRTGSPTTSLAVKKGVVGSGPMLVSMKLDGVVIRQAVMSEDAAKPGTYEARVVVPAGKHRFEIQVPHYRGGDHEEIVSNNVIGRDQPGTFLIKLLETEGPFPYYTRTAAASQLKRVGGVLSKDAAAVTFTDQGQISTPLRLPSDSSVTFRVEACATRAGVDPARIDFQVDGQSIGTADVLAPARGQPASQPKSLSPSAWAARPQFYEVTAKLPAGEHEFTAAFINPFSDPSQTNPNLRQRGVTLSAVQIVDPQRSAAAPDMPEPLARLFRNHGGTGASGTGVPAVAIDTQSADARGNARGILQEFTRRAWRRPVPEAEIDRLMRLYDLASQQEQTFPGCVKLAMKAVLVSPKFLYRDLLARTERPSSDRGGAADQTDVQPVDEYSLASRLSYFLWSTTPDDELLDLADRGQLRANLTAQIKRMLASPRSDALVQNFGGQWLQFRSLDAMQPAKQFTKFSSTLRAAIKKEPELVFNYVMRENHSIIDFLNGDYTFANERLANFYGIKGVTGDEFRKVSLEGTPRRGVLTEAGILMLTSNPTRTSPVKRGKWVLDRILGAPPAPPPPNIPALDDANHVLTGTLRQKMEQHRSDPNCMSCHAMMDPIGFGLENFDAIGDFRTTDAENTGKIETAGTLATGESFADAMSLIKALSARQDDFVSCFSEQMLTYALGRGVEYYDRAAIDEIVAKVKADDNRFATVIQAIVESVPFQMERSGSLAAGGEKPL